MTDERDERLRRALRAALPRPAQHAPARDLWPLLRRRIEAPRPALSRLDWALFAALLIGLFVFPESLLIWLYHL